MMNIYRCCEIHDFKMWAILECSGTGLLESRRKDQ